MRPAARLVPREWMCGDLQAPLRRNKHFVGTLCLKIPSWVDRENARPWETGPLIGYRKLRRRRGKCSTDRTVPSMLPDASCWPSGRNATLETGPVWPRRVRASRPVRTAQSLIVRSSLADARCRPSGLMATAVTKLVCPVQGERLSAGGAASRASRSCPCCRRPGALPSGVKARLVIGMVCRP